MRTILNTTKTFLIYIHLPPGGMSKKPQSATELISEYVSANDSRRVTQKSKNPIKRGLCEDI